VSYPGRTPHIHVIVAGQGLPKLTTQLYNDGEPQNERDHLFRAIAPAARDGVLMKFRPAPQLEAGALLAESRLVMPV
jgi:protocatechuate 3,4-dioxygenase beta subunit